MAEQSKLEQIAIEQRAQLLGMNIYNQTVGNQYSVSHTRAKSDTETPIQGKGTGVYMDTHNGGGYEDIHGVAGTVGTGRLASLAMNDYNYETPYETPDTSLNIGQINL